MYIFEVREKPQSWLSRKIFGNNPSLEVVIFSKDRKEILSRLGDHWVGVALTERKFSERQALAGRFNGLDFPSESKRVRFGNDVSLAVQESRQHINYKLEA